MLRELSQNGLAKLEELLLSSGLVEQNDGNKTPDEEDNMGGKIRELEYEIETVKKTIQNLEESKQQKTRAIATHKSQMEKNKALINSMKNEIKVDRVKLAELKKKVVQCKAGFSRKDVLLVEETKKKIHACCLLTGVTFNQGSTTSGYIVNQATQQLKMFNLESSYQTDEEDARGKLWEKMEQTTYPFDEICENQP